MHSTECRGAGYDLTCFFASGSHLRGKGDTMNGPCYSVEVLNQIYRLINCKEQFIKLPCTSDKVNATQNGFYEKAGFPVIAGVDKTHVQKTKKDKYTCKKGFQSMKFWFLPEFQTSLLNPVTGVDNPFNSLIWFCFATGPLPVLFTSLQVVSVKVDLASVGNIKSIYFVGNVGKYFPLVSCTGTMLLHNCGINFFQPLSAGCFHPTGKSWFSSILAASLDLMNPPYCMQFTGSLGAYGSAFRAIWIMGFNLNKSSD